MEMTSFPTRIVEDSQKYTNFTFVQVGAHDGVRHDPINKYIKSMGWGGLLIEPVPRYFEQLKKNYALYKKLKFANYAIAETSGKKKIYGVSQKAPWYLWQMARTKDSFSRRAMLHNTWFMPGIAKYVVTRNVKTARLKKVLEEFEMGHVHLYVIDTEGYDYQVLKQIDFDNDPPEYIYFEHLLLSKKDKRSAWSLLENNGYEVVIQGMYNTVAYRQKW